MTMREFLDKEMPCLSKEDFKSMRDWLAECATDADDLDVLEAASDRQVVKMVQRMYDGGLASFKRDSILYK